MTSNTNHKSSKRRTVAPILDPDLLSALVTVVEQDEEQQAVGVGGGVGGPSKADSSSSVLLQLTNGGANALHDCQEEFVKQLTLHLQQQKDEDDGVAVGRCWIKPEQIQAAMISMGLEDILNQALRYEAEMEQQQQEEQDKEEADDVKERASLGAAADFDNEDDEDFYDEFDGRKRKAKKSVAAAAAGGGKKKKRKMKKKGGFTPEMIAEQERLLAASLQKQS